MAFFKAFRDQAIGLSDLLRYAAMIDDGVMLCKGGELMAGFYYQGTDTESSTAMELNAISSRLNAIMCNFGNGWMVHCDSIRGPALGYPERAAFPDPVSMLIDEERRYHYQVDSGHFQSAYVMVFTWLPPSRMESKGRAWMFETSGKQEKVTDKMVMNTLVNKFKASINDVENALRSVFLGVDRMGMRTYVKSVCGRDETIVEDTLLSYLHYAVTGIEHFVRLPSVPMYLDTLIGSQDFVAGMEPKVGDKNIRVINIEGFPADSYPGILDYLNKLPLAYRFSTRFIFLDPEMAKKLLDKLRKKWRQKTRSMSDQVFNTANGAVDLDALNMMNDAEGAMADAGSGQVRFGHYTAVVVLMSEDATLLKNNVDSVVKAIRDMGFTARIESVNAVEAYLGSLPGHGVPNVRRPILHSLNLANLLPTTALWAGPEQISCPFYGDDNAPLLYGRGAGATPFRLSIHVGDVGHTLILGPTGAGKSTLLNLIMVQHRRYKNAKVFAFDKGASSFVSAKAMGGDFYDVGGEGSALAFCPLSNVDKHSERVWAEGWIDILLTLNGVVVTPRHRGIIQQALISLGNSSPDLRTMTHFQASLQDHELRNGLDSYCGNGAAASLLDAEHDNLGSGDFQVFEMENLMNMGEKNLIPVLLYLFHRIEQRLDGSPVLLVLDEAWLMLSHPLFMEKIREWLKVLRKANTAVIFATQSLEDITRSPIAPVIFQSCPTKILLPNPEARNELSAAAYRMIGLNERQVDLIAMGTPKRDYYYMSPSGRRMFSLDLGEVALAFVGKSGKDDIKLVKELISTRGEKRWVGEWLRRQRLSGYVGKVQFGEWME